MIYFDKVDTREKQIIFLNNVMCVRIISILHVVVPTKCGTFVNHAKYRKIDKFFSK